MRSKTAAKVITIYSIVFGALVLSGAIGNINNGGDRAVGVVMGIAILALGIIGLVVTNQEKDRPKEKAFIITLFVIYCIYEVASFIILFVPFFGMQFFLIIQAVIAVPFSFSIVYLVRLGKEAEMAKTNSAVTNFLESEKHVSDFEQKIHLLKKLKDDGLISEEEYKNLLSKHLNQNI